MHCKINYNAWTRRYPSDRTMGYPLPQTGPWGTLTPPRQDQGVPSPQTGPEGTCPLPPIPRLGVPPPPPGWRCGQYACSIQTLGLSWYF